MNIRRLKKSEILLLLLCVIMCGSMIARALHIKKVVIQKEEECSPVLEMAKGDIIHKETEIGYSHLVCHLQDVELDHSKANHITIDEYENAANFYNYRVCNDTLYLEKNYLCEPNVVTDESLNATLFKIGSQTLKSITVGPRASIKTHIKPVGGYASGKPAYKERDLEKHTFKYDSLNVNLSRLAEFEFFGEGKQLTINSYEPKNVNGTSIRNYRNTKTLYGTAEKLVLDNISGNLNVNAQYMEINSLIVNPKKIKNKNIGGTIKAIVTDTIEAYLYDRFDVLFTGYPHITKEETNFGRVLNINYELKDKLEKERKRQELILKQVDKNKN